MPYVTLCIANDEDFLKLLLEFMHLMETCQEELNKLIHIERECRKLQDSFPNCKTVASVLRSMYTVEDGDWMAIYLIGDQFYETPVHHVHSLEAVGAGDAFAAALIHMLKRKKIHSIRLIFQLQPVY